MAEVGRLGARMAVDELGIASENQQRRESRGYDVRLAHVIVLEVKFIELAVGRRREQPNTECELRCMVFSQNSCLTGDKC